MDIASILERWMFNKNNPVDTYLLEMIQLVFGNFCYDDFVTAFTSRLKEIDYPFTESEKVSGSGCFYGGMITSILHFGYVKNIEGLFTFSLCYMLVDNFLDNKDISEESKTETMRDVFNFITGKPYTENPLIKVVKDRYLAMISETPKAQHHIVKLFKSEYQGHRLKDGTRGKYLEIAEEKGGLTTVVISAVLGLDSEKDLRESMKLGACIQLVDDFMDLKDDISLNIMTVARHDIQNFSCLDSYVTYTLQKISDLDQIYNTFRPLLIFGLLLGIKEYPDCVSLELQKVVEPYFIFTTNKESIITWFYQGMFR